MGFKIQQLWQAPEINPVNNKAKSIPILNPFNKYGMVFNFSWFGFFIAFWAWYAFPPLINDAIKKDVPTLTKNVILNSNIIALTATLIVRAISGPLCDKFGPRKAFAGILIAGCIPSFCAGGIYNPAGLYAVRFFVGILGGSFVPCQVWTTAFFDKNVVGTANALTAGWGNSGGGITYFIMPAVYTSLMGDGLSQHVSWRVAFVVPSVLILITAIAMLLVAPDTPTGKWSERLTDVRQNLDRETQPVAVDVPGELSGKKVLDVKESADSPNDSDNEKKKELEENKDVETLVAQADVVDVAQGEVIRKPTMGEIFSILGSLQTIVLMSSYFCSFGAELAFNGILGSYYMQNFKSLGQQGSGNWAAMFGLLNIVFRPLGGLMSDVFYKATGNNLWAKKFWVHFVGIVAGAFFIAIGLTDSHSKATMFGLVAGMAFFLEAGNGANFALVPHVHPYANGVVSGFTGASGNFGGIIFSIIYRYAGTKTPYARGTWIMGIISIAMNVIWLWVRPIPRAQVGGR